MGGGAHLKTDELPAVIRTVRAALLESSTPTSDSSATETDLPKPTRGQIKKSIGNGHLISFVDNRPYKTLKRHLERHGMSMNDYRERYGLPSDYPSVAPSYSAARSAMAKSRGFGVRLKVPAPATAPEKAPAQTRRKAAAAAEV